MEYTRPTQKQILEARKIIEIENLFKAIDNKSLNLSSYERLIEEIEKRINELE